MLLILFDVIIQINENSHVDNALYPILFYDCFMQLLTVANPTTTDDYAAYDFYADGTTRFVFLAILTALLTFLNLRGLDVVGNVSIVICALSLLPFLIFCIMGAPSVQVDRWFNTLDGGVKAVNWRLLLNTFFWNINYWESAACFSADVEEPAKTFPRGLFIAVVLVFLSLFLPVLVGIGVSDAPYSGKA